ncbi:three-Cys-motif partner protein TcmP [Cellulomonas sp. 179-A 4D5 NHS]|uniref:three-Cys-motif partner protein TcmP n=1 Tax=Cellulomonas sp. 179-A 4D5 NHS TaxID=3142378 RepID=UPI0039A34CDD
MSARLWVSHRQVDEHEIARPVLTRSTRRALLTLDVRASAMAREVRAGAHEPNDRTRRARRDPRHREESIQGATFRGPPTEERRTDMAQEPVVWDADPHTKAKHDLYRRYLDRWMPIMIRGAWKGDVTYAEGFSGPGVYADGSPGSPLIAFDTIRQDESLRARSVKKNVRMLFVEQRSDRCDRLREELAKRSHPLALDALPEKAGITVEIRQGSYDPTLVALLDEHRCWGKPILAVLDSWGGGVNIDLVQRIAKNPSSEVLITLQPQFFSRFADAPERKHGDAVFGHSRWRDVAKQPSHRKTRWLIERYRDTIHGAGFTHVLDFELVDHRGASLYLVFGTAHDKGLQKMKEAMWEVDPGYGSGYRDPRDPNQQTLLIEDRPQTHALRRLIRAHLEAQPARSATVHEICDFAFRKTIFKTAQASSVVKEMAEQGDVIRVRHPQRNLDVITLR